MRFLFGDSTPFPLGYNFLTTLEAFMSAATRIVQLDVESQQLAKQREEIAQNRVKGLEALEQFHTVVMRAVQDTAQKVQHTHALEYASRVAEFASQYVEEHRRSTLASNERESLSLRADADRRATEMKAHLEAFLKAARFPILKTKLSLRLIADPKDQRPSGSASFEHPDNLQTSFTLAPHRAAAWSQMRRVADFAQGVDLMVGVEKSWLRGTVTAKQQNVDDWTVVAFETSDDTFQLTLRKKPTEKEMLVFHIRRTEGGLIGTVEHPGAPGAEGPANMVPQDLQQLERVWAALRTATRDVLEQKEQLLNVALDGQPVFEAGLAVPFVVRLVNMFAPTVREISKRSPNEFELTLKMEVEGGRREELYLRKETLVSQLQPLPAKGREVFAPLGLDNWVPSMTTAPPPVVVPPAPPPGPPPGPPGPPGPPPGPGQTVSNVPPPAPSSRSNLPPKT